MKLIFKILTAPVVLVIDLFTLICIGVISFSGMLLRLVSGIIAILGVAVLATYSPKNGLNRLSNLPWYLSKAQKDWLKNRTKDRRPEIKALAQEQYDMRFGRRHQEMQLDDMDEFDEDEFEEME